MNEGLGLLSVLPLPTLLCVSNHPSIISLKTAMCDDNSGIDPDCTRLAASAAFVGSVFVL